MVELEDAPAAVLYAKELEKSAPAEKRAGRASAAEVARGQMRTIESKQQELLPRLASMNGKVLYRVSRAFNGVAVLVDGSKIGAIRRLPGVKSVRVIEPDYPTNSTSVPFLGTPSVWGGTVPGLLSGATGSGIRIGIIDTGIDYLHADFGGTGALATYQGNDTTTTADGLFPTAKVVGGYDFAGDSYTGGNAPSPDADPMDCNGHGSHVSGTAAGYGVNPDGTTYAGPWNASVSYSGLRIGPGTAPQARLYALRVFGCTGSTSLTTQAIDWAIDPNDDGDFSDHLDVINMSLGSAFGSADSSTAIASENAALAGVIVVASAGNSGDTFFITGAPGSAGRAISVAASADSGLAGSVLTINSPAGIARSYAAIPGNAGPAPAGQTFDVVLALDPSDAAGPSTTDGCTAFTNSAAVAGKIALIDRGTCTFAIKIQNAMLAGASGMIIANNVAGDPTLTSMAVNTAVPSPTIPNVFISMADGTTIKTALASGTVNATFTAATQADMLASFSSRGPRLGAPVTLKPDITAPGSLITSVQTGKTCTAGSCITPNATGFIPDNQAVILSGTSMASPHMAGIMALARQIHPDWSVEELKALAMNGALHNLSLGANGAPPIYDPARIGAGRVDPPNSSVGQVTAFNADDPGLVSVSFDVPMIGASSTQKLVRLVNHGATNVTYNVSVSTYGDAPGVSFSAPSSVTVPARTSVTLPVTLQWNAAQMNHTRDASLAPTQTYARHWLTQESSYLNLSVGGVTRLRVPLYASTRPASAMSGPTFIPTGGAPSGSTTIPLSGTGVCTGTMVAGPGCTGTFPTTEESFVTPFELQVASPRDPSLPANNDLQYAGVKVTGTTLLFGVSTWGDWSTPREISFSIYIDIDSNGTWDRVLFNSDPGTMNSRLFGVAADSVDAFMTAVYNPGTGTVTTNSYVNGVSASSSNSAPYKTNVMFLSASYGALGMAANAPFRWKIETCPGLYPLCGSVYGFYQDQAAGPITFLGAAPGLNFGNGLLFNDLDGATLPVTWNTANMTANGSLGALLLHTHNVPGTRAQVIPLQGSATADLAVTNTPSGTIALNSNVTFTIGVINNGPDAATGVQVVDLLPAGLTYVSDNGGGSFNPATGVWSAGNLANAASASLQIVAKLTTTSPLTNTATIGSTLPLDTNLANNSASVTINAVDSADLQVAVTPSVANALSGTPISFTVTVTNLGPDISYNITVNDVTTGYAGLPLSSFTASVGTFNPVTGVWTLPSLAVATPATLTLNYVAPLGNQLLTNTATVSAAGDPVTANNTASANITITNQRIAGMGPATVANQDSCQIAYGPAATLLLPYFEVDATNGDRTTAIDTAFTITNVSNTPIVAHITLWSDWSYPVLDFNVWLTGYDVQGISLYDILALGKLPATSATTTRGSRSASNSSVNGILAPGAVDACTSLPASIPDSLRAAIVSGLTGGAYTVGTLSCGKIGNVHSNAVGYVTIDTANTCSQTLPNDPDYFATEMLFQNQLTGDYLRLAPSAATGNYAGGSPLVHIQAVPAGGAAGVVGTLLPSTFYQRYQGGGHADRRQPLPALFAARFISSPFATRFPIWREGPYSGTSCPGFQDNSAIPLTDVVRFDEHENPTTRTTICQVSPCPPGTTPTLPETSAPSIQNTSIFPDPSTSGDVGGWVFLNLDNPNQRGAASQNWVIVEMTAEGRYGVDFDATYLANGCTPAFATTTPANSTAIIAPQD